MRALIAAVTTVSAISAAHGQAILSVTPNKQSGSVGICILISDHGTVERSKVVESSGDRLKDESALDFAATMRWPKPPFPKPGWLGIRIDEPDDKKAPPMCDPKQL